MNIRILTFCIFSCLCSLNSIHGQELKQQGKTINDLIPTGWTHKETWGDLNKDGITDLVVVATPDWKEKTKTRDDGYVYNFNQPILAIYFGTPQGVFWQWSQYADVIPANTDEYCTADASLNVTKRGVLCISIDHFCSMGGYGKNLSTFSYRFQDGDFYLIGMDDQSLQRNTGDMTTISENYLTGKRQEIKDNAFNNSHRPVEKWSKLPKKALEKLGTRCLD